MANDEFDNRQADKAILHKLQLEALGTFFAAHKISAEHLPLFLAWMQKQHPNEVWDDAMLWEEWIAD